MSPSDGTEASSQKAELRYVTGVLRPVEEMHPVERALAAEPTVTPVAIHQLKLLDDGT